jgi:hypothetical protein
MASKKTSSTQAHRSEFSLRGIAGWAAPYLAPWLISAMAMPVALLAHIRWGHDAAMAPILTLIASGLTLAVYHGWSKRHRATRTAATAFTGFLSGWTVFAIATDPLANAVFNAYLLGSVALSVMLCAVRAGLLVPHAHDEADKATGRADKIPNRLADAANAFRGGRVKDVKQDPRGTAVKVQLKGGNTASDLQSQRENAASALSLDKDQITVTGVRGRADQAVLTFTALDDPQTRAPVWHGPSIPGGSVGDGPLRYGLRSDGVDQGIWVCGAEDDGLGEPRPLAACLTTGMTGSGKTQTVRTIIVDGRWRVDFVPVVGDAVKPDQSFGDIADTLAIFAKTKPDVLRLIRNIPQAVSYRQTLLANLTRSDGQRGYDQWEPECWALHKVPLVFLDLEEATEVLTDESEDMDRAVRTCRSVGIFLNVSLQTAPYDNIPRKTRGQFAQAIAHGCDEQQDAKFALSAATREAGADPTQWKNTVPGAQYSELVHVPAQEWSIKGRSLRISRARIRMELDESRDAGIWAELDEGTYKCLAAGIGAGQGAPGQETKEADGDEAATDLTRVKTDEGDEIDVTQPLAPSSRTEPFVLVPPHRDVPAEQARAVVAGRLADLERGGQDEITFTDVSDLVGPTGKGAAWLYKELNRLVDSGRLEVMTGGKRKAFRIKPEQQPLSVVNGRFR